MNVHEALIDLILGRGAILVAGSGVSIAATGGHPLASWRGLLRHALEWLLERKLIQRSHFTALMQLLSTGQTHHCISAAQDIVAAMGGLASSHFSDWLAQTVGALQCKDPALLEAIHAVRRKGNLLATTNYDGLLLGDPSVTPLTWRNHNEIVSAVRAWDETKVLYLHGHWREPESVIFDLDSYNAITRAEEFRTDQAALWKLNPCIYICCGQDGLRDPDLGLLFDRNGKRARQAGHWDFCLVRDGERAEFDAFFKKNNINIKAVPYGREYADLAPYLRSLLDSRMPLRLVQASQTGIPRAPECYAEPPYLGSHRFVGCKAYLQLITAWANAADPTRLLLFVSIGGGGKSMLTWEWFSNPAYALAARPTDSPWAGRFWYSFYEHGAGMSDFCRRALAYMTGRPMEEFARRKTADLAKDLVAQLRARPWFVVLDGLERILVHYHRLDAAEVLDEEANTPTDEIAHRNPCDVIHDEDGDFLRALVTATPSKILVSSRLIPRALLNASGQLLPGARLIDLPGLEPCDAEELLRSCGLYVGGEIRGDSAAIQAYLTTNCGNHPLMIGVLGGLINNYLPARGDFDAWLVDPEGGAGLDLGGLDLVHRHNHILRAAVDALGVSSRQLLVTLSLVPGSVDFATLNALNPHSPPSRQALWVSVRDLESRGLLQFGSGRYDLHPVVRSVVCALTLQREREGAGQKVVDYFMSKPHVPYEHAETLEDVRAGFNAVQVLIKLGQVECACLAYYGSGLSNALIFNLGAFAEVLALLKPVFPSGWLTQPRNPESGYTTLLMNHVALTMTLSGELATASAIYSNVIRVDLAEEGWIGLYNRLMSFSWGCLFDGRLAAAKRLVLLALELAITLSSKSGVFLSRLLIFRCQSQMGQWQLAQQSWRLFDPMGRNWSRYQYRSGDEYCALALAQFWQGQLQEDTIVTAERLARDDKCGVNLTYMQYLRAVWCLEQRQWAAAATHFAEVIRANRAGGAVWSGSETGLALAKLHLGELADARSEVERLSQLRRPAHRLVALLWLALGEKGLAIKPAVAAYREAWGDGEPYVSRYELDRSTELLNQLGAAVPTLPRYDRARDVPFPWEAEVRAVIERLRAEQQKKRW